MSEQTQLSAQEAARTPTKYRVLKKVEQTAALTLLDGTEETGFELWALLPGEHGNNPVHANAREYGGGSYLAVPLSSFKPRTIEVDQTPRLKFVDEGG